MVRIVFQVWDVGRRGGAKYDPPRPISYLQYATNDTYYPNASLRLDSSQYVIFSQSLINADIYFTLREKCPNTEFFLVGIFPHSD